jgi:hypothetical protein
MVSARAPVRKGGVVARRRCAYVRLTGKGRPEMTRWIGLALLAAGAALAALDLIGTAETGARLRALGEWWFRLDRDSLQLLQPAIERHVAVWVWDPVVLTLLEQPAAALLGAMGAVLLAVRAMWRRQSEF